MTDLKSRPNPLFLRHDQLHQGIELLFYAYRDFTAECDAMLATYGFGRAHHRVIYFVARSPAISVAELLASLRITKQSLSRVLSQLVQEGFISVQKAQSDRRRRLLQLTDKGLELERRLSEVQRARIGAAYRSAGGDAVEGYRKVLLGIIDKADRQRFED